MCAARKVAHKTRLFLTIGRRVLSMCDIASNITHNSPRRLSDPINTTAAAAAAAAAAASAAATQPTARRWYSAGLGGVFECRAADGGAPKDEADRIGQPCGSNTGPGSHRSGTSRQHATSTSAAAAAAVESGYTDGQLAAGDRRTAGWRVGIDCRCETAGGRNCLSITCQR
jgi:hypothetical protein